MNRDTFISASAGTGKTFTLVEKYLNILENEDIKPYNILAVTFTKKAANEMKERVSKRFLEKYSETGNKKYKEYSERIIDSWISTFHSFCLRVLRESILFTDKKLDPYFDIANEFRHSIESNIVKNFCNRNLKEINIFNIEDNYESNYELLLKGLSTHRHDLYIYPPYNITDPSDMNPEIKKVYESTGKFSRLFNRINTIYEETMQEENSMDYDQIIEMVRRLFLDCPEIKENFSKRFKYILVDEFQDTDRLQNEIIKTLKTDENKLLFVGDEKQSIYRFRGAEVDVFIDEKETFERQEKNLQHLDKSYRSHPDLIKFHNTYFNDFIDSYRDIEAIKYERDEKTSRVRILENFSDDSQQIADYINNLLEETIMFRYKDGKCKPRKIKPGDIAILLRKFTKVENYEAALENADIPFYTVGSRNFFQRPEISGLIAWLKFIADPNDDLSFTEFFLSPAFGGSIEEVLLLKKNYKHFSDAIMDPENKSTSFIDDLRKLYWKFIKISKVLLPSELLEEFITETGYTGRVALLKDSTRALGNLYKLREKYSLLDELGQNLRDFAKNLNAYLGSAQEGEAVLQDETSNSVKLLTIHQAKGLEFPIVIIGDMNFSIRGDYGPKILFDSEKGDYVVCTNNQSDIPIINERMKKDSDKEIEEDKRLLYVAMTRPREMLILSLNGKIGKTPWGKANRRILNLFKEINEKGLRGILEKVKMNKVEEYGQKKRQKSYECELNLKYLKSLEGYSYRNSYSPTTFNWKSEEEDYEIEFSPNSYEKLGSFVHGLLEALGEKKGERIVTLKDIIGDLKDSKKNEISQNDKDEIIGCFQNLNQNQLIREIEDSLKVKSELKLEKRFKKFNLKGIIDKLYLSDEGWKVVDFKYAFYNSENLEEYRFQMRFYLYLLSDILKPVDAKLLFLKDGKIEVVKPPEKNEFERELMGKILSQGSDD